MSAKGAGAGTVIVLGATSAIARATASELARAGHSLVLAGRDQTELEAVAADLSVRHGVRAVCRVFDALAFETHPAAWRECLAAAEGELAGVVICIGTLGDQRLAETDFAEARRILDTNLTAAVSFGNLAAEELSRRGEGFLCALSSVAGDRGRAGNYLYGAAKAGLSAYLQGLRGRLHRCRVAVVTVKPGFVDTKMTFGRSGMFLVASPESVGRRVAKAIRASEEVVYVPSFWRPILWAVRAIPERLFKRLKV